MSPAWAGIFCALWTPTDQQGRILEAALEPNIAFLKEKSLDGLLALGSTGEFLHLDPALRKSFMERALRLTGPLRVMMNISDIRPAVVSDLGDFARQLGVAAVSLLPPYFYPLAQEDLIGFFVRTGERAGLPLFLYNFPERTGNRIAIETVAAVAERVQLGGVKQSGNEFGYHTELVQLGREKGFVVLTGADTRLPEAVAMGVSGCVSGLCNAVPELVTGAFAEAKGGPQPNQGAARRLSELGRRIQKLNFPLDVAACMEARGLQAGSPKGIVSTATRTRYQKLVAELQELFREWGLMGLM